MKDQIRKNYSVWVWLTAISLAPIFLIIYFQFKEFNSEASIGWGTSGIILGFFAGFILSFPMYYIHAYLFDKLIRKKIRPFTMRLVLSLTSTLYMLVIFGICTGGNVFRGRYIILIYAYTLAILTSEFVYRMKK